MDSLQANTQSPLILVVEDSPTQAERLRGSLTLAGYRVTIARNGTEGLAAAKREPPAIVIADILMPVMDGDAMCHAIRRDEALKDTPVILLTALTDVQDVIRGLNAGADFYVTKPYHEPYLLSLLSRIRTGLTTAAPRGREVKMELVLEGKRQRVSAGCQQMLNLLVSIYENSVLQCRELAATRDKLQFLNEHLEEKVQEKTAALQANEARLSALLQASPVCVFDTDVQGDYRFVNERWRDFTGYTPAEAGGRGWMRALHPGDRERVIAEWYRAVADGRPFESEYRFQRPDGAITWVYEQTAPLLDAMGDLSGYVGTIADITARKQAEAQISRLVAVVEQASDSIVITDLDGAIVYVNPFFEQLTGFGAAEAVGENPRILKSGLQSELLYRDLWDTVRAGRVWSGHFVNRRKDGRLFHEDATVFPIQDGQGRIINYAAVKKDVTLRVEAEAQIRKLTQLYATLSHTNQLIVRATSREELFAEVCRGAVEHGRFALAWVGVVDEAARRVRPVHHFGREDGYLENIRISIDDVPEGRGPTGMAVREGRVAYVNDYSTDERALPWREAALCRGLRGAAALPIRLGGKVICVLTLYAEEPDFFDPEQVALLKEMSFDLSFALDCFEREACRHQAEAAREAALSQLRKSLEDTVQMAAATIELRDPYTSGHQQRTSRLAKAIACEMGLGDERIKGIGFGSQIHDIGKIAVPAEILSKPTKLSDLERAIIRTHAEAGYALIKNTDFPWPVAEMIRQHHERLDGSGYPDGLKDGEILLEAKILMVADVVEAMSSHRPYRPGLGTEAALAEIVDGRGAQYDQHVVDACLRLFREKRFDFGSRT